MLCFDTTPNIKKSGGHHRQGPRGAARRPGLSRLFRGSTRGSRTQPRPPSNLHYPVIIISAFLIIYPAVIVTWGLSRLFTGFTKFHFFKLGGCNSQPILTRVRQSGRAEQIVVNGTGFIIISLELTLKK